MSGVAALALAGLVAWGQPPALAQGSVGSLPQLHQFLPAPAEAESRRIRPCPERAPGVLVNTDPIPLDADVDVRDPQVRAALGIITNWGLRHLKFADSNCFSRVEIFKVWQDTVQLPVTGRFGKADLDRFISERDKVQPALTQAQAEWRASRQAGGGSGPRDLSQPLPASWTLKSSAEQRSVFGLVELGAPLAIPPCKTEPRIMVSAPCVVPRGNYGEFPEARLQLQFVYMASLPGWMRPIPFMTGQADCSVALQSRQAACQAENEQRAVRIPPPPSFIAVTWRNHVIEVFLMGQANLCEAGFRAFQDKYGKPGFVNSDGSNIGWSFEDFGADILCGVHMAPKPLQGVFEATRSPHTQYRLSFRPAFQQLHQAAGERRQQELDRAGSAGPRL